MTMKNTTHEEATFKQIARCLKAYRDLDAAFWPFVHAIADDDETGFLDNGEVAELMRRMLAVTLSDIYFAAVGGDRDEFLAAADADILR